MSNHQHTLIIDGTSGISGDMTVAALLEATDPAGLLEAIRRQER